MTIGPGKGGIETAIDGVMANLATLTASPARASAPFYRYGPDAFRAQDSTTPRIRFRLGSSFSLTDPVRLGTDVTNWRQEMIAQVWGSTEDQTITEATGLIGALRVTENIHSYWTDVQCQWFNQEGYEHSKHGFAVEIPFGLNIICATPVGDPVTILTSSLSVTSSLELETFNTGSMISGSLAWIGPIFTSGSI